MNLLLAKTAIVTALCLVVWNYSFKNSPVPVSSLDNFYSNSEAQSTVNKAKDKISGFFKNGGIEDFAKKIPALPGFDQKNNQTQITYSRPTAPPKASEVTQEYVGENKKEKTVKQSLHDQYPDSH